MVYLNCQTYLKYKILYCNLHWIYIEEIILFIYYYILIKVFIKYYQCKYWLLLIVEFCIFSPRQFPLV